MRNNSPIPAIIDDQEEQLAQGPLLDIIGHAHPISSQPQPGPDGHSDGAAPSPRTRELINQLMAEDLDEALDEAQIVGNESALYENHATAFDNNSIGFLDLPCLDQDRYSDSATGSGSDSDSESDSDSDSSLYATPALEQQPSNSDVGFREIYDHLYDDDSGSEMSEADSPDTFPRCPALTPAQVDRQIELAITNYRPHLWVTPLRSSDNNEPAEKNNGFDRDIARPA